MENKNENLNQSDNSALHKNSVSRSDFEIYDRDWKTFDEEEPPTETPVWLKLHNNNVVQLLNSGTSAPTFGNTLLVAGVLKLSK